MRTWNALKIATAINFFLKDTEEEVDPIEWLSHPENIVLENEHGDLALFEYGFPTKKVYSGHYFFKSRGRQAIEAARGFLDELFNTCYNIHVLMGMVPKDNRPAQWMSRQVGFTFHGEEEIGGKLYHLFIITRNEFNEQHLRR